MEYSWKPEPESDIPIYIQIADHIKKLINSGFFKSEEKLSERKVASQFNVSRNTVTRAFNILRDYGFLESYEKSSTVISKNAALLSQDAVGWSRFIMRSRRPAAKASRRYAAEYR